MELIETARGPINVSFGCAFPDPSFLPAKKMSAILGRAARISPLLAAEYQLPPGYEPLRRQIARRSPEFGCNFTHNNLVITNGAMEAVHLSLRAVAKAGDVIAVESPIYYGAMEAIDSLGMRMIEIPTHPRQGIDLNVLEDAIRKHGVKACFAMTNVHNPLGFVLETDRKRELAALAARYQVPVIEDDVYGDFVFGTGGRTTAKQFDREGLVLYCGSVSKSLGGGYRMGWLEPGRFRKTVERLQFTSTIGAPSLQQIALADLLASGGYERHVRKLRSAFERNMAIFREAIARYFPAGTRMTRPAGGFVLWVQLPGRASALALYEAARAQGISVLPGDAFSPGNQYPDYIRMNCGYNWSDTYDAAVRTLGRLCAGLPRVT
ncbi:MAG: PLP-dependent aminotransferase family protein [Acidobacteria bacterium]|nr:PLP-dependent aminotransferase family protein [Acidobacteriota bacterium]